MGGDHTGDEMELAIIRLCPDGKEECPLKRDTSFFGSKRLHGETKCLLGLISIFVVLQK
jgi:hypothetical protein